VRFEAEHNYNRESREAMYAWMARWLQQAPADVRRPERSFTADPPADLLVFYQRPQPANAVTAAELTYNWIEAARRQLASAGPADLMRSLRHVLGVGDVLPMTRPAVDARNNQIVLVADVDGEVEQALRRAQFDVRAAPASVFDVAAADKVRHFETYNRTPAGQRVAALVDAIRANPGAAFVAAGDAALAGLLAAAIAPPRTMVLDVGTFDTSSDEDYVSRLYIPGLRRAGDLRTAVASYSGKLVIHNAGERFVLDGHSPLRTRMSPADIVAAVRNRGRSGR
jgi:hypothetical protein